MALPKQNRLSGQKAFSRLFRSASPITCGDVSIRCVRAISPDTPFRCSVVVSTKTAPAATTRNNIRRKVSEAFRRVAASRHIPHGVQIILSVRSPKLPDHDALEHTIVSLLKKSGILTK